MENQTPKPKRPTHKLRRLLGLISITYCTVCVLVAIFQTHLIYYPTQGGEHNPGDIGLAFDNLRLETEDGVTIAAWYVAAEAASFTLLYCHGNAGNLSLRTEHIGELHRLGFNVLAFDYRGFGLSKGQPSEAGTYLDAEAAWDYLTLKRNMPPSAIVLYGRSLGGAVAVELAKRHPPAALILDSTFTSLADVAAHHYRFLPVHLLIRHHYDSLSKISAIPCPKLFLHGRSDKVVPFELGRRLFDAAAPPKRFVERSEGHSYPGLSSQLLQSADLLTFLHLNPPSTSVNGGD